MYWALPNSEYYHPVRLLLDHLPLLAFIDLSQHTSFLNRDKSESNRSPKFTDTPSRSIRTCQKARSSQLPRQSRCHLADTDGQRCCLPSARKVGLCNTLDFGVVLRSHMLQPTSLIPLASAASSPPRLQGSLLGGAATPCPCRILTDWITCASWRTSLASSLFASGERDEGGAYSSFVCV